MYFSMFRVKEFATS